MSEDIFEGIDLTDPCAIWPKLEAVLYSLLSGQAVVRSRIGLEDVTFYQANVAVLETKIRQLKANCAARQAGQSMRRRAIRATF